MGKWLLCMLLPAAFFAATSLVWAGQASSLDPDLIRQELERLRVLYSDEHPDVILLQRKLEKAEELKRLRQGPPKKSPDQEPSSAP
ncbi:hypothetical protein AAU61_20120 [Desulfocarbo indianensis]|nr:hypothetical protein AAU61_20120 [Desulfocarbo indianensis]